MVMRSDALAAAAPGSGAARTGKSLQPVRVWLWTVALCIFAMVIVGGATRLTQSGLSITEWNPVMGAVPPLSEAAWQAEFEKYKAIPQYAQVFPDMDLGGFKAIFYWEWAHRLLGRVIGLLFAVPLLGFWLTGRLTPALKPRLLALLALGGLQGAIGWWMVKSGLSDRVSVSQYRLAVHLLTASVTLAWAIWIAEGLRSGRPRPETASASVIGRLRLTAALLLAGILVQLGLGALVAGLHAGLVYNTWPLIDGRFVPPLAELLRDVPVWSNPFENVTTAQFDHRMLAYGLLVVAALHAVDAWRHARGSDVSRRALLVLLAILAQAGLGITALLLVVPLWAALLHQGVAMLVLGTATVHCRRIAALPVAAPEVYSADAMASA